MYVVVDVSKFLYTCLWYTSHVHNIPETPTIMCGIKPKPIRVAFGFGHKDMFRLLSIAPVLPCVQGTMAVSLQWPSHELFSCPLPKILLSACSSYLYSLPQANTTLHLENHNSIFEAQTVSYFFCPPVPSWISSSSFWIFLFDLYYRIGYTWTSTSVRTLVCLPRL